MKKFGFSMGGGDLSELLEALKGAIGQKDEDRKVKKSVPARKEWVKMHDDIHVKVLKATKMVEALEALTDEMEADKKKWWATIELGLDDFTTDKRWNTENKEVEILVEKEDKKKREKDEPVKSPFQKGEL